MDNASLIVKLSNTLLLTGSITGSGSVTQSGTGTTILTGQNTYTGGTEIDGGALQIGNGGATLYSSPGYIAEQHQPDRLTCPKPCF